MLTKRQKQALVFINNYISRHDYAPSLEEIKKHLGLSSVSTAHYLSKHSKYGLSSKETNQPRAIDVIGYETMLKYPFWARLLQVSLSKLLKRKKQLPYRLGNSLKQPMFMLSK
jgi:SOS-response transcriptional repressor LexA